MKTEEYAHSDTPTPTNTMFPKFHTPSPPHTHRHLPPPDGATIEVVRRPRGRPPGSKNKPKSPIVIQRDASEPTMSPYVLELPAGADIVQSTARFCRNRGIGLCVLTGNGVVSNVTLRQPSSTPGATVTFHGRFDILSISATILPAGSAVDAGNGGTFTLSLAGPQGQVVGGLVAGPLVAAGTIYLVAATFNNPSYHRLQSAEHDQSAGDDGENSPEDRSAEAEPGGVSMYSYQSSDVIWAPTARQAPPPPQY